LIIIYQYLIKDSDYIPYISIGDLKDAMKENSTQIRDAKILTLRHHINQVIEEGRWDIDDIFRNNDFADAETFECVVYYVAG